MGYMLFDKAEHLHLTVAKLLTGRDLPLSNIEVVLSNTYQLVKQRLEKQQGKRR